LKTIIVKKICAFAFVVFVAGHAIGQKEVFDMATFVAPRGWDRVDSNGVILFQVYKGNNSTSFCQIFLYPSRAAGNDAMSNFETEWNNRVTRMVGNEVKPETQTGKPQDGWIPVEGHTSVSRQGITFNCVLVASSGYGRVMSVIVNIAGQEYVKEATAFLDKLELHGDGRSGLNGDDRSGGQGGSGQQVVAPGSLADYIFAIPPGWTPKQYPDGIVLFSPASNTTERCNITLLPFRASSGNLRQDAENVFHEVFKIFALTTGSTQNSMIRGVSPQGWEYFMIKNSVQVPGGNYLMQYGFVLVAKLGNQVAALSGISKDPLVSACFGLNLTDVWPAFFYSLTFRNWKSSLPAGQIMKRLAGTWMIATATAGDRWVFAPNGRYASAAAAQRYAYSSTEALTITDAYFGNGSYSLDGYRIFLTGDNDKSNPKSGWFRIEQESFDNGNTWHDNLYLLRTSNVDGKDFEVRYHRQK
jgi:hypothetical protein